MQVGQPRIVDRSSEAIAASIPIELSNPNHDALRLVKFDYIVEVNGERAFAGQRAAQTTLASSGTRNVEIPFVIPFERLGWEPQSLPASAEYRVRGKLEYVTPGEIAQILFDTGVRTPRAGFADSGTLTLR